MYKILTVLIILISNFKVFGQETLLDKIFEDSKSNQQVLDKDFSGGNTDLVSIVRNGIGLLSKFALAVGVTLFIWGGVRFFLSVGEESKIKKAREDLILVGVGLLLTLASLAILYLLQSVPRGIEVDY